MTGKHFCIIKHQEKNSSDINWTRKFYGSSTTDDIGTIGVRKINPQFPAYLIQLMTRLPHSGTTNTEKNFNKE